MKAGDKTVIAWNFKAWLDNSVTLEAWITQINIGIYWRLYGVENRN